jgi:hypothetical protein
MATMRARFGSDFRAWTLEQASSVFLQHLGHRDEWMRHGWPAAAYNLAFGPSWRDLGFETYSDYIDNMLVPLPVM